MQETCLTLSAPLTLGTAGHIDHGKTALIRALTGVDTDRLPEERERGISIELGYAPLTLPGGRRLSVVDVPGHERFVRTMVAGATGIDLYLMTVAADDGVMPQTREHAAVLAALGVTAGVVAVTKADVADPTRALREAAALLPGAEAVAVSARTGAGLDELGAALDRAAERTLRPRGRGRRARAARRPRVHDPRRRDGGDRARSGRAAPAAATPSSCCPSGRHARVRGVQVHDEPVDRARPASASRSTSRAWRSTRSRAGTWSSPPRPARPPPAVRPARPARPVRRAAGCRWCRTGSTRRSSGSHPTHGRRAGRGSPSTTGRARPRRGSRSSAAATAQLRLEQPLVARAGDRIVIRSLAPPDTLGGGVVLDPAPRAPRALARPAGPPRPARARRARAGARPPSRLRPPPGPSPRRCRPRRSRSRRSCAPRARSRRWTPTSTPPRSSPRCARPAARSGSGPPCTSTREALDEVRARLVALLEAEGEVTLARLRDELGTSRKYAQALLEHFDAERLTLRRGDARVLRRRRA